MYVCELRILQLLFAKIMKFKILVHELGLVSLPNFKFTCGIRARLRTLIIFHFKTMNFDGIKYAYQLYHDVGYFISI